MFNARKKFAIVLTTTALAISAVGIASAQQGDSPSVMPPERQNPVAEYISSLGITPDDLTAASEAGLTWQELIEGNGGDVQALRDIMVAQTNERLDDMLDNTVRAPRGDRGGDRMQALQEIADASGLDVQALAEGLRSGTSLSEIITANGGDLQATIDAIVATRTTAINERVANGELTQERADALLAELPTRTEEMLNRVPGEMGDGLRDRFQDRRDNRGGGNQADPVATPDTSSSS